MWGERYSPEAADQRDLTAAPRHMHTRTETNFKEKQHIRALGNYSCGAIAISAFVRIFSSHKANLFLRETPPVAVTSCTGSGNLYRAPRRGVPYGALTMGQPSIERRPLNCSIRWAPADRQLSGDPFSRYKLSRTTQGQGVAGGATPAERTVSAKRKVLSCVALPSFVVFFFCRFVSSYGGTQQVCRTAMGRPWPTLGTGRGGF